MSFKNPEVAKYGLGNYTGFYPENNSYLGGLAYNQAPTVIDKSTMYNGPALGGTSVFDSLGNFMTKYESGFNALGNVTTGLSGLAGAYTGFKQLGLAEDAFNFNKAMKEKEYAMAKDAYDRNVKRATSIGEQMNAGKVG